MAVLDYARGRPMTRFGARFQEAVDPRVFSAVVARSLHADPRKPPGSELSNLETLQAPTASTVILAVNAN